MSSFDTSPGYVITPSVDGPPPPSVARRDQIFYLRTVVFKADDEPFNLPRFSLPKESKFFDDIFTGTGGTSDTDPVVLKDAVTAEDFRSLLKLTFRAPELTELPLSVDDWMSVLKLANTWSIRPLHALAAESLKSDIKLKTPIEKIVLAGKYDVSAWLQDGLTLLASQRDPISVADRDTLGWEWYGRLMDIRERWRRDAWTHLYKTSPKCSLVQDKRNVGCPRCGGRERNTFYDPDNVQCQMQHIIICHAQTTSRRPYSVTTESLALPADFEDLLHIVSQLRSQLPKVETMVAQEFAGELQRMKGRTV